MRSLIISIKHVISTVANISERSREILKPIRKNFSTCTLRRSDRSDSSYCRDENISDTKYYELLVLGLSFDYNFMPLVAIPSIKYFCATMYIMSVGTSAMTEPAIIAG